MSKIKCNRCGRTFNETDVAFPHDCICSNISEGLALSETMFSEVIE